MTEWVSIANDGYSQFFKAAGMSGRSGGREQLNQQGAAELFWGMIIERLQ